MLDEIEKIATDLLSLSKDEVRQIREALLVEVAQDDARYAARTALNHPEGSTTPLNDAADRSQQTYTKVRSQLTKELPKLLALILAEQVAGRSATRPPTPETVIGTPSMSVVRLAHTRKHATCSRACPSTG